MNHETWMSKAIEEALAAHEDGEAPDPEGGAVVMFRRHLVYQNWMPEVIGGVLETQCEALKALPTFKMGET